MSGLKYCRICLDVDVRMFQISGSEVQNVYEKLTNKKVQEDGTLYYACFVCHRHLQNCHQLVVKSQKWDELSKELLINSKLDPQPIPNVTRLTYGLVHSLTNSDTESFHTQGCDGIIKTEIKSECEADGVVVKHEPDDGASTYKNPNLNEKIIFHQNEANSVEIRMKEDISETETHIANEPNSSQIASDGKRKQTVAENENKKFVCNDCGKTCETKARLITHLSEHDAVIIKPNMYTELGVLKNKICEKSFQCQYCSFTCRDNYSLKKHSRTHTKGKLHKCEYCNYTSMQKGCLKVHVRSHTGEKPFKCQYCNYSSAQSGRLTHHIRTHTNETPFKCQYCDYNGAHGSALKKHIRSHPEHRPYKCPYCDYTGTQRTCFRDHIKTHTGEKPFECKYCDYTCAQSSSLTRHVRTHSKEKPFKCQYCDYKSTGSSHITRHLKIHTGEKPFKCQHCDYKSAIRWNLKLHIRSHTGEKPFKCQQCDYKCANGRSLKNHIRTHTREKPF